MNAGPIRKMFDIEILDFKIVVICKNKPRW